MLFQPMLCFLLMLISIHQITFYYFNLNMLGNSVSLESVEKHIPDYLVKLKKTSDMETQDLLPT